MPTYEYRCRNGHDFEEFFLKMSAAKSELPCPTCGERGERRLSAGGGLVFKGSGFYITDYGKDGKKAQPTAKGKPAGEGARTEGTKSDGAKTEGAAPDASKSEPSKTPDAKPSGTASPAAPAPKAGGE